MDVFFLSVFTVVFTHDAKLCALCVFFVPFVTFPSHLLLSAFHPFLQLVWFMKKQFILTVITIAAILLFFLMPQNREWLNSRVFSYWKDFPQEFSHQGLEYRKIKRHKEAYVYSVLITKYFNQKNIRDQSLVLVPSTEWFKKRGISYEVPEPVVFYYFTGLKTVAPSSKEALNATHAVLVRNGGLHVDSLADRQAIADAIRHFNTSAK